MGLGKQRFSSKWFVWAIVLILAANFTMGCTSESRSIKKETLTNPTGQTVVVEKATTTHEGHAGLLGGVFHVVGEILAFPFQVVADLFRFIF